MHTCSAEINLSRHDIRIPEILSSLKLAHDDIVLLCGSVIEGFSNAGSDLDVYVISKKNLSLPSTIEVKDAFLGKEYTLLEINRLPINVIVVSLEEVVKLMNEINSKLNNGTIDFNESRKIEIYHRLMNAYSILNEKEYFNVIYKNLEFDKFRVVVARNRLNYSENRHDDAIGALESSDFLTAYISARLSLEKAMESLLFLHGQTNPKDKWIIKRIFNVFEKEEDWVQDFIKLYFGVLRDFTDETVKSNTVMMIRLANKMRDKVIDKL